MLIAFFEIGGLVHQEFVPRGQSVNTELNTAVLHYLCNTLHIYHPEKWYASSWIQNYGNDTVHRSVASSKLLGKQHFIAQHHPYSPDLALCDLLFSYLRKQ